MSGFPNPPTDRFIDPKVLMAIRNLEWRARTVVEGFWTGLHRSPYHGFSVEFTEYRQYTPGDDTRYLDWRLLGRSDRYFIKRFEDETNLRCHLILDRSRSMDFGSQPHTKATYAATLAACLAYFLQRQGDAAGLLTFDEAVRDYLPARHRPGHLRRLFLALEKEAGGKDTDLIAPLRQASEIIRKRGLVVLISDLLAPADNLETSLTVLAAAGQEISLFQVLDPVELTLDLGEPAWFEDVESGRQLFVDPAGIRKRYQERMEEHSVRIQNLCQRLGVGFHRLVTDQPLETALFEFLRDRSKARRTVRRYTPSGGMRASS
ncbi:MAG: DUF58 domain-containing protein [Verrucomicrobiales bacterium]|nr:DUF58 domain-containing protein [Verrucomicrobiales bacterium]